jgi:hypothetical protein
MGSSESKPPPPPDKNLVPPRFNRRAEYRERYSESTFDHAFGSSTNGQNLPCFEGMRNLFATCNALPGCVNVGLSLADNASGYASQDGVTGIRGNIQVPYLAGRNVQLPEVDGSMRIFRDYRPGDPIGSTGSANLPFLAYGHAEAKLATGEFVLRGSLVDAHADSDGSFGTFGEFSSSQSGSLALGARYSSPATSLGALFKSRQLEPTSLEPARAWGVHQFGGGTVGAQVSKDPNSVLNWQAGVLLGSSNDLQCGLRVDDSGRRASLSYFQHFPFLRKIMNPLETRKVKGIVNHVDVGLELSQDFAEANNNNRAGPSIRAAASYEINKNWMVKGNLEKGKGISGTVAFRSWTTPGIMVAVTSNTFTQHLGITLHFENTGAVRYEGVDPSTDAAQNVQEKNRWQEGIAAKDLGAEWAPPRGGGGDGSGWSAGQAI